MPPVRLGIAAAVLLSLAAASGLRAAEVPPWLPRYDLDIEIDVAAHRVSLIERVTWTNRHERPADELVFNVYPRYKIPEGDFGTLAKTLELLRLTPRDAMDPQGVRGQVNRVTLLSPSAPPAELPFTYRADNVTALVVPLPRPVRKGESVTVELEYVLDLPPKQGRWGQWPVHPDTQAALPETVTQLSSWMPVLAYYDDSGWHPTPFVPWHQPFFNEAGLFAARVTLPADQVLACSAAVRSDTDLGDGRRRVETVPIASRDFALMCCARYERHTHLARLPDGREVPVYCYALPGHDFYGRETARISAEAIATYSRWFGPYPYSQFTIAETYFGWNGNECSGLIMIDARVFAMPHLAVGYVEYLVSHETCHQWFYNVIGTNGYAETFMDEGFATYLTHRWMDRKLGRNNPMLAWPDGLKWLPNIERENYRWASFHGALRRGESPPALQPLPKYGHVVNLFTGAYDRGSKVVGMIEDRLGEAAFLDFLRRLYDRYAFRVIRAADLRRELEEYTGQPWEEFFDRWVYGGGLGDWGVNSVTVGPAGGGGGYRTVVRLRQHSDHAEQTVVGFRLEGEEGYQLRLPVVPNAAGPLRIDDPPAVVQPLGPDEVQVEVLLPRPPAQVAVDPDQVLIDADPANNYWHPPVNVRATPLYTPLDETDLTTDYDRWNVIVGPWLYSGTSMNNDPWYVRPTMAGLRAGLYRTQRFNGGVFAAYRTDFRDLVLGADGLIDHWPHLKTQVGFNFEHRIAGPIGLDAPDNVNRAVFFGRYVFQYNSSLYLPPIHYLEAYTTYQDNFLPFARRTVPGARRPDRYMLGGLHYRVNYLTPYWHPEGGFQFDASYSAGGVDFIDWEGYHALQSEFRTVRRLPDGLGRFSDTTVAGHVGGAIAFPDKGQYFALGGSQTFRGFDLSERQGSLLWYAGVEARLPLLRDLNADVCDHIAGLRNVYLATFYDVGAVYADGEIVGGNVAHALGVGLRFDVTWFSLIERTMLRFDAAKTLNAASPWQFWFGVQHPF